MTRRSWWGLALVVVLAGLWALTAVAQNAPGGQPGAGRRGRGNFDPAQMRQRMADRMKQQLGATDDEWKALGPKIEKIQTLQMQSRPGAGMRGMGRRGPGGPNGGPGGPGGPAANNAPEQSAVQRATQDLSQAIQTGDAGQIKEKLTALRDAREKAHQELVQAQNDLKPLLSVKQEAVLVMDGLLD